MLLLHNSINIDNILGYPFNIIIYNKLSILNDIHIDMDIINHNRIWYY